MIKQVRKVVKEYIGHTDDILVEKILELIDQATKCVECYECGNCANSCGCGSASNTTNDRE